MSLANVYAPPEGAFFTKFKVLSVASSTESSSPGLPAPFSGEVSNHPGGELAGGLLLICLFAAALLIPFERLIPQERDGNKSLPSTSTGSRGKKRAGGTARGQYDAL